MPDSYADQKGGDGVGEAPFQSTPSGAAAIGTERESQIHVGARETHTGFDFSDQIVRMTRIVIEWAIAVPDS